MDSPAGSDGSTSPPASSGFLTTGPLRQAGSAGSKPVRRVLRSPGLTPVDFGFPLSMRRSHVRALIRAHLEDKKPQQRITWVTSRPHPEGDPDNEPVLSGVPALLRYRTQTEEELMAAVPRRIPQLVQQYWGYSLMPFQRRILELLFTGGYVDILVPTLHGKSTLCDVVFPILSLMHNPNGAHIICCTNHQDAKRWLLLIKQKLESSAFDPRSSELLRDYPWLAKPKGGLKKWSTTEITIDGRTDIDNPNPSVFAIGRGSDDIKGRRAKFVGDDLEGKGAVRETARAELWDWMTLEAMRTIENRAIEPRRLFANIGTPWDPDCLGAETPVQMANGERRRIADVQVGDQVLALTPRWRLAPAEVTHRGVKTKPVFRVSLKTGLKLEASADHRVLTWKGWQRIEGLRPGDYVTMVRRLPVQGGDLTEDDALLLAVWLAEGTKRGHSYSFTNTNPEIVSAVKVVAQRRGWDIRQGGAAMYRVSARRQHSGDTPNNLLRRYGCWGLATDTIRVPAAVFRATDAVVAVFLAALIGCDGSVNRAHRSVSYGSVSEAMVRDVQALLLRFGIRSSISHGWRRHDRIIPSLGYQPKTNYESWLVTIGSGEGLEQLALRVGILGKGEALREIVAKLVLRKERKETFSGFPPGWFKDVGVPYQYKREGVHVLRGKSDAGWTHAKVERAAVLTHNEPLRDMATGDVTWLQVTGVTYQGEQECYDLEVAEYRNFIADGLVVHNSIHFRLADLTDGRTGEQVFTVFRQPYKHESGRLIWPLQGPRIDELRQAWKEDTRQWQIAMELNPKGDNPFALTLKEIQDHSQAAGLNPVKEAVAGFVTLDPASGSKNARADYAGIAVMEIRWPPSEMLPFVKVTQAYRYTDEAFPQVLYAADLSRQCGYPVVVEMNAMQRVYKGLFQRLAPDVKVIPFYTTEANKFDKRMGLSVLKTLARSDRLAICDSEGGQTLMREIRDLGTGAHDHLAMAVWFPISFVYQWHRRQARRKQVVSTSPARGYQPLVGRRTLRIVTPFQARTGSPFAEPPDERLLVDTHPG
jgi:intein/homing endonuclease